ncbi:DUF1653 domain-containing protein [Clostridium isatidis]|mgnify:CR=1 FL=1|uniref:DUF1653 domain-containing protein n=1 Tax=Clostridium isatidis TaxID=182773 RepID=UPI003AB028AC
MKHNNTKEENNRLNVIKEWEGKVVKHFKGDLYLILDTNVIHTETNERMIYYKALYGDYGTFVRPASMFAERCNSEQFEKYGQEYRFELAEIKSRKK